MKVGFACGVFDLFHAGHVRMLRECKEQCDYLIVALNKAENLPEGKSIPVFSIEERVEILEACKYVNEIKIYNSESELLSLLSKLKIDIRFLGDDYRGKPITGSHLNIELYYTDRSHGLSTTGNLKRIAERLNPLKGQKESGRSS